VSNLVEVKKEKREYEELLEAIGEQTKQMLKKNPPKIKPIVSIFIWLTANIQIRSCQFLRILITED